ncbi:MAG: carboxypeptidase-like regulatory domain-containing protein [Terriglobales bacterium]
MKAIRLLVLAVAAVLLIAPTMRAQTSQGRILGTIRDTSGAVVQGATVTVTNTATGISREVTSSNAGEFVAPDLEAGPYSVKVQAKGFASIQRTGIGLEVAKDARVRATETGHGNDSDDG